METCKWYVSIEQPECGQEGVAFVTAIPLRNGHVRKLDKSMPVCREHQAESRRRFAAIRSKRVVRLKREWGIQVHEWNRGAMRWIGPEYWYSEPATPRGHIKASAEIDPSVEQRLVSRVISEIEVVK